MTNPEFDDIELSNVLSYIVGGVLLWHSIDIIALQSKKTLLDISVKLLPIITCLRLEQLQKA